MNGRDGWLGRGHLESLIRSEMLVRCESRHMGCVPFWILHVSVVFSLCSVTDQESYGQAQSFQFLIQHAIPWKICWVGEECGSYGSSDSGRLYTSCRNPCLSTAKSICHVIRRKSSRFFSRRNGPPPNVRVAGARGFLSADAGELSALT